MISIVSLVSIGFATSVPDTILGFHYHAIKNKNQNHSMNKVKNLREKRGQTSTHSCQMLGLCGSLCARYLGKCFTQIYRALYGDAKGHKHGGRKLTETCNVEFCFKKHHHSKNREHENVGLSL